MKQETVNAGDGEVTRAGPAILKINFAWPNKQLNKYLINKYGDQVCFAYSRKKVESQMFFSSELKSPDIANTVRNTDVTVECTNLLCEE